MRCQEIVLRPPLNRKLRDILILRSAEDQDRNLRRQAKEAVEGLDSAAVGQEEVHEHRRYDIRRLPSQLVFLGEALQALGAEPHPLDPEGAIARVYERLSNEVGVPAVILDQKYGFRHDVSNGKVLRERIQADSPRSRLFGSVHAQNRGVAADGVWSR